MVADDPFELFRCPGGIVHDIERRPEAVPQ